MYTFTTYILHVFISKLYDIHSLNSDFIYFYYYRVDFELAGTT
jgi:hypothetical protein